MPGKKHSVKTRIKMSTSQKNRFEKEAVWNKGLKNIYSDEALRKMSEARKGKPSANKGKKFPQYSGARHPNWKGGRTYNKGYVYVKVSDHPYSNKSKYMGEHRLIMEQHIGRYLERNEVIHHINGVTDDNRIENLKLLNNTKEHNLKHRRKHTIKCPRCKRERTHKARGYCGSCYSWWRRNSISS